MTLQFTRLRFKTLNFSLVHFKRWVYNYQITNREMPSRNEPPSHTCPIENHNPNKSPTLAIESRKYNRGGGSSCESIHNKS